MLFRLKSIDGRVDGRVVGGGWQGGGLAKGEEECDVLLPKAGCCVHWALSEACSGSALVVLLVVTL